MCNVTMHTLNNIVYIIICLQRNPFISLIVISVTFAAIQCRPADIEQCMGTCPGSQCSSLPLLPSPLSP